MIWHVDFDKAHRCPRRPECDGYVSSEETGWEWPRWHVYRCGTCGLRVARGLLIPHHPESGYTWRWRARWFWLDRPRLRWEMSYWPRTSRRLRRAMRRLMAASRRDGA